MSEDQIEDVKEEVVAPESNEQPDEQVAEKESPKEPEKGSSEYNFREMRKVMEQQQRRIQELEHVAQRETPRTVEDEKDDLAGLNADDFLTVKQAEKLAYRKAQELIKERDVETLEDRTRLKFKDYDDTVSEENIKQLIEDDRELAADIAESRNPYATAYKLIKKSAFYKEKLDVNKKKAVDQEKIAKNISKPVSSNAIQSKPLAAATSFAQMSKDEMASLYKEMQECASRRS